jgi:hypothetical protein
MVGSIGTMTYVQDTSGAYEKAGIKVTLIATGKYKGQWIDGNPVSEDYIAEVRREVEDLNEHFLSGVEQGRGMSREQLLGVADGRVFIASEAQKLGLIDEVASLDAAASLRQEHADAYEAIASEGYEKARAELTPKPATASELLAEFPGDKGFCMDQLAANATVADARAAFVKAQAAQIAALQSQAKADADGKDAEIARLKAEVKGVTAGADPVTVTLATTAAGAASGNPIADFDAKVKELTDKGTDRTKAVAQVVKSDPDLHLAYVEAMNAKRRPARR